MAKFTKKQLKHIIRLVNEGYSVKEAEAMVEAEL